MSSGIKATELIDPIVSFILTFSNGKGCFDIISDSLDELVATGQVIEVEYVLPQNQYSGLLPERVKSIYFPTGTKLYSDGIRIDGKNYGTNIK